MDINVHTANANKATVMWNIFLVLLVFPMKFPLWHAHDVSRTVSVPSLFVTSVSREMVWRLRYFVQICNMEISQFVWKTVFKRKQMRRFKKQNRNRNRNRRAGWPEKKKWSGLKIYRWQNVRVRFKQNLLYLGTVVFLHNPIVFASSPIHYFSNGMKVKWAWDHWGRGSASHQPAEHTCRHANTTWEGQQEVWLYVKTVVFHKPTSVK